MQAALGQLPADAVARAYPVGSPKHAAYTQWGTDALTTAVFEIIISGTMGSLLVRWLSPFLLKPVRRAHQTPHALQRCLSQCTPCARRKQVHCALDVSIWPEHC